MILSAATRAIASRGLGAATAMIAKEAGVSNGSLFLSFETKSILLNELFISLKTEMAAAATAGLASGDEPREQVLRMWGQWLQWATTNPQKRYALAQLDVAQEITPETRATVAAVQAGMATLVDRIRVDGPMRDASLGFALTLTSAIADAAMDAMIREPATAAAYSREGFTALWRVLAGDVSPAAADTPPSKKDSP